MKLGQIGLYALSMVTSLTIMSCTRPGSSANGVALELAIPQPSSSQTLSHQERAKMRSYGEMDSAFETTYVQVIILNITGAGMSAPIYYQWQNPNHSGNSAPATPPSTVTFNVPVGNSRLIQALVVSQGSQSGLLSFNYGDLTADLTSDNVNVTLTTQSLGGNNSGQGKILGRYLDATGNGPTGIMNVLFTPAGKPSMLVQQGEIFGGYFEIFGLQGVGLTYQTTDGTTLFSNAILSATSSVLAASTSSAASVLSFPNRYGYNNCASTGCTGAPQLDNQAEVDIVGFFGPGAATKKMYLAATSSPSPLLGMYIDANSTAMTWQTTPNVALGAAQAGLVTGGVQLSATAISTINSLGTPLKDFFYYDISKASDSAQAMGFKGPYAAFPSTQNYANFIQFSNSTTAPTGLQVAWQYAPNASSGLFGSEVFYQVLTATQAANNNGDQPYRDNSKDNAFLCSDLVGKYGFTSAGKVGTAASSQNVVIAGHSMSDLLEVIICPIAANGQYYETGVDSQTGNYGSANFGSHLLSLTWTSAVSTSGNYTLIKASGNCQPYTVTVVDPNGNPSAQTSAVALSITDSALGLKFYSDAESGLCTSGEAPTLPLSIPAGASSAKIWVNASSISGGGAFDTVSVCPNCTSTATGNSIEFLNFPFAVVQYSMSNLSSQINFLDPMSGARLATEPMAIEDCYPVSISLLMSGTNPSVSSLAPAPGFKLNASGGSFFQDQNCTVPLANNQVNFTSSDALEIVYFLPTSASTITISATPNGGGNISAPTSVTAMAGGETATNLAVTTGNLGYYYQGCNWINIQAENSAGAIVPGSANVSISAVGATIYAVPATSNLGGASPLWCTTVTGAVALGSYTGNASFGLTTSNSIYYFVPNTTGADVILTVADVGTGSPLGSKSTPLVSNNLYLSWNSVGAGVSSYTQAENTCLQYKVSLLAGSGTAAPIPATATLSFNISTPMGTGLGLYYDSASCAAGPTDMASQPYVLNFPLTAASPSASVWVSSRSYTGTTGLVDSVTLSLSSTNFPATAITTTYPLNVLGSGGNTSSYAKAHLANAPTDGTTYGYLLVDGGPSYCYPLSVELDSNGGPTPAAAGAVKSADLSFTGGLGAGSYSLYSNPLCAGSPNSGSTVNFAANDSVQIVYLMMKVTGTGTLSIDSMTGGGYFFPGNLNLKVGDANVAGVNLQQMNVGAYSGCFPVSIGGFYDAAGIPLTGVLQYSAPTMSVLVGGGASLYPGLTSGNPCAATGAASLSVPVIQSGNSTSIPQMPFVTSAGATLVLETNFGQGNALSGFMLGSAITPARNPATTYYPVSTFSTTNIGASGTESMATQPATSTTISMGTCTPINIYLQDSLSQPAMNDTSIGYVIDSSNIPTAVYYTDAGCGSPLPSSGYMFNGMIPSYTQNLTIYFKGSTATGTPKEIQFTPSNSIGSTYLFIQVQ